MRPTAGHTVRLVVLALGAAGVFPATAGAASQHVVSASATMNRPTVVAPGNITWDASLVVPFKVAGLGNQSSITATLAASSNLNVNQTGTAVDNISDINEGVVPVQSLSISVSQASTPPLGTNVSTININGISISPNGGSVNINVNEATTSPGSNSSTLHLYGFTATLTSDKNGQATGTLRIPAEVDASTTGSECVHASWTAITLTIGTMTVNLPNVANQYDSTGSFC